MAERTLMSGGKVGVDIVPDASGFGEKLRAMLARFRNESVNVAVNFDPDAGAYRRVADSIDGRTLRNVVRIDGDANGLKRIGREYDKARKDWENRKPVLSKFSLDKAGFAKDVRKLTNDADKAARSVGDAVDREAKRSGDAVSKQSAKTKRDVSGVRDTFLAANARMRDDDDKTARVFSENVAVIAKQRKSLKQQIDELVDAQGALRESHDKELQDARDRVSMYADEAENLKRQVALTEDSVKAWRSYRDEIRKSDPESYQLIRNKFLPDEIQQLKDYKQQLKDVQSELRNWANVRDRLETGREFTKLDKSYSDSIDKAAESWKKYDDAFSKFVKTARDGEIVTTRLSDTNRELVDALKPRIELMLKAEEIQRKHLAQLPKLSEGEQLLADSFRKTDRQCVSLYDHLSDTKGAWEKHKDIARELTGLYDEQEGEIRRLSKALGDMKPLGIGDIGKQFNQTLQQIKALREYAQRHPIEAKLRMDKGDWERSYEQVLFKAERLRKELEKQHDIDVRVKVWDDQADNLEARLDKLRRTRVDIPVEWQVDQESIIARMREISSKIKANPDRDWELEANLDLSVKHAEEKFKKFEESHDKVEADLDLKTLGARAHMAAFTRPRSVEIIATLNTTQAGKILNGMLYGATGLRGVENQFERLVNVFDKFDTVVPKISMVGAALGVVSAGAVNLTRSALGVAGSLVSMSKAAFALPGALVGVGAALLVLKHAWGDQGGTFSSQIDIASTKLAGFGDAIDKAFYDKARPAIRSLMDDVSGTLIPGVTGIADAEGDVVAGLADIIRESDKAGELPRIFSKSEDAIRNLVPGLSDIVQAMLDLGDSTSDYLPRAADWLSQIAAKTAEWVETAQDTGSITRSMADVVEQGGYLKDSIGSLTGILTGLYTGLAENENGLEGFRDAIGKTDDAVNSWRFQDTLATWADGAQVAQSKVRGSFEDIGSAVYELRDTVAAMLGDAGDTVASFTSNVSRLFKNSKDGLRDFSEGASEGLREVFDAIGDAAPAVDDLLSMFGQLSKTFGGTLGASLKAAAPLVSAMASSATAAAEAFSRLPAPVQAAIGLYMTFGRAGKEAFDTLKVSMLENTVRNAQWLKQLNDMGVAVKGTKPSIVDIGKAWLGMSAGVSTAGQTMSATVAKIGETEGVLNKVKVGASGVASSIGSLVGPWGLVAAAVGVATVAWSDWQIKASATDQGVQRLGDALKNVRTDVEKSTDSLTDFGEAVEENLKDPDFGEDSITTWLSDWTTGFDSAADAAGELGMSVESISKALSSGSGAYDTLHDKLTQIIKDHTTLYDTYNQSGMQTVSIADKQAKAAQKVLDSIEKQHKAWLDEMNTLALANGHVKEYATRLEELGESADMIAIAVKSAAEKQDMLNDAWKTATEIADDYKDAQIRARSAASDYYETIDNLPDAIARVNELVEQGGSVWSSQTDSFNFASEAGRLAQETMDNLGASAQDYVKALVSSGESEDVVRSKAEELSKKLAETASSFGIPEQAAKELQEQYSLTPSEITTLFKAEMEQSKAALTEYLANYSAAFPDGNRTAIYNAVLDGINSGALSSVDEVQRYCDQLIKDPKDVTIRANTFDALRDIGEVEAKNLDDKTVKLLGDMQNALDSIAHVNKEPLNDKIAALKADIQNALDGIGRVNLEKLADKYTDLMAHDWDFWTKYNRIKKIDGTTLYVNIQTQEIHSTSGGMIARPYASGGRVFGSGTSTSDSIPAWLSTGEGVVRAASLKKLDARYGAGFFDALNRYGDVDKALRMGRASATALRYRANTRAYADGGRVTSKGWSIEFNPTIKVEMPKTMRAGTTNITLNGVSTGNSDVGAAVTQLVAAVKRARSMS